MFAFDIPVDLQEYATTPVLVASVSQKEKPKGNFDYIIGVCHLIDNRPEMKLTAYNVINPLRSVRIYFNRYEGRDIQLDGNTYLFKMPNFGRIDGDPSGSVTYVVTKEGYVGKDYAELIFKSSIKIKYTFNVMERVPGGSHEYDPYDDIKLCPKGKYWREK